MKNHLTSQKRMLAALTQPTIAAATILTLLSSTPVFAHVVLDQPTATAGSTYRAALRVGHGCDGLPTTSLKVVLPPVVRGAKPMPKPGWALQVTTVKLDTPYTSHGKTITSHVSEITWTATTPEAALPDAHFDEFVLRATLPSTAGTLWFKVEQGCEANGRTARNLWTQVPSEGSSTRGLDTPAAALQVEAAKDKPASHH
jgi:periplasmic copper chaperone A